MKKSLLVLSFLVIACGKGGGHKPASPTQTINAQEMKLKNDYKYDFENQSNLDPFVCNTQFVEEGITYLGLVDAYINTLTPDSNYDEIQARLFISKHSVLKSDLYSMMYSWESKCPASAEVPVSIHKYTSSFQGKLTNNGATNDLVGTLESIDEYKNALDRVLAAFKQGATPLMKDVETLHIYQQELYYKERPISSSEKDELDQRLNEILGQAQITEDLGDFKVSYEYSIEQILNKEIVYNRAYYSVPSKVMSGKTQCLGGTKTDLLLNLRARGENAYYQKRPVVILEPGHMLSGFMVGAEGEWYLYGIESTAKGRGEIYYGNITEVSNLDRQVKVIDAYDYLYLSAIQSYLARPINFVNKAFINFTRKYSVKPRSRASSPSAEGVSSAENLKSDIFGFGVAATEPGSRSRPLVDKISRSSQSFRSSAQTLESLKSKMQGSLSTKLENFKERLGALEELSLPGDEILKQAVGFSDPGVPYHEDTILDMEKFRALQGTTSRCMSSDDLEVDVKISTAAVTLTGTHEYYYQEEARFELAEFGNWVQARDYHGTSFTITKTEANPAKLIEFKLTAKDGEEAIFTCKE